MAVKTPVVSTLNPNAPLFVPAAFVAAEDFSPEWWRLIQTSPAFRDYWLRECYGGLDEEVCGDEIEEVVDDFIEFEWEMEQIEVCDEMMPVMKNDNGFITEEEKSLVKDGDSKNSKKLWTEPLKQFDKVPQKLANSPRKGASHRIQQPR